MNQWIWQIFITCDKHCANMKTRLNVIVYFLFLNAAKRGVDINVGNISVGNYFVQEVFRRFFRKWKSPLINSYYFVQKKIFSGRNHELTKNQHMSMPRNFLSEIFRISDAFFASGNCPIIKFRFQITVNHWE